MRRRAFIQSMCAGGLATFTLPAVTFARVPGRGRLVFVLLRGAMDGLASVVPYGDPGYPSVRQGMAFAPDQLVPLTDEFGLAPGLASLKQLWDASELVVLHGVAIPFRTRSHFDGQAILETGLDRPAGSAEGWLNRLLQIMDGERSGIAVAAGLPRSLSGSYQVMTWSPAKLGIVEDAYIDRLHVLYQRDARLHDPFEASLQMADVAMDGMGARRTAVEPVMRAAAQFLGEPDGPNVAAVEFSGWDTHANQGLAGGQLDRRLAGLAEGLLAFKDEIGPAAWASTTIVVMTEFGRTARPNGTGGTDHGTAGAAFVIGPSVGTSRVVADWPGLGERDLFESRDLRPTLDTRAVLKGVAAGAFDLTAAQADRIFPGSSNVRGLMDLLR
jgi:uncharacterized protein (DUF1501 family)